MLFLDTETFWLSCKRRYHWIDGFCFCFTILCKFHSRSFILWIHTQTQPPFAIPFSFRIVKDLRECSNRLKLFWALKEFPYRQSQQLTWTKFVANYILFRVTFNDMVNTDLFTLYIHTCQVQDKLSVRFTQGFKKCSSPTNIKIMRSSFVWRGSPMLG